MHWSVIMTMESIPQMLIVDADLAVATVLASHLQKYGYLVRILSDGLDGLRALQMHHYHLAILDALLPGMTGQEICRQLRQQRNDIPILMFSEQSDEGSRVQALESGADDCMTKPFGMDELLARCKALLRRTFVHSSSHGQPYYDELMCISDLEIDRQRRTVNQQGKNIDLTMREFDLLCHFAAHPGRVYTRMQLLDQVWGEDHDSYEHTVNSHINRLRNKIEPDPANPKYILTVWGVGYKFFEENSTV